MSGKSLEIELKFSLLSNKKAEFMALMSNLSSATFKQTELSNTYFETPDSLLRQHDCGLRIRGFNDQYEMTLKTAAKGPSGLLQRDEYNYPLTDAQLDLDVLPKNAWPSTINLQQLKSTLHPQFTTDFLRSTWLVELLTEKGPSLVEVALDEGTITSGPLSESICEVELELKEGQLEGIFELTKKIVGLNGLRLSELSKAARGYRLNYCQQNGIAVDKFPLPDTRPLLEYSDPKGFYLDRLFFLEESFLRNMLDIETFIHAIDAIQLQMSGQKSPRLSHPLSTQSSYLEIKEYLYSSNYNQFKLFLLAYLTKI